MPLNAYIDRDPQRKKIHPHYLTLLFEKMGHGLLQECVPGSKPGMVYPIHLGSPYRLNRDLSRTSKGGGVFIYDHLNVDAWKAIYDTGGYLLIDHIVEAFFGRQNMVERLHEGLATAQIDPAKVVLLNGNLASSARYDVICKDLGIVEKAHVIPYNGCFWLVNAHNQATGQNAEFVRERALRAASVLGKDRPRKFVTFNGKGRPHRTYVVLRMIADGYGHDGFISLLGHESSDSPTVEMIASQIKRFPQSDRLTPFISSFVDQLPLTIDVSRENSREAQALKWVLPWTSPEPDIYDQTYFSVVLDTSFTDEGTLFQTPIAYKSFMNFSPFVYFGNRGGLEALRNIGFKSFHPFIREDYDSLEDHNERVAAAYSEFERLVKMSHAELDTHLRSIWPALEHNYNLIHRSGVDAFKADWNMRVASRLPNMAPL